MPVDVPDPGGSGDEVPVAIMNWWSPAARALLQRTKKALPDEDDLTKLKTRVSDPEQGRGEPRHAESANG
jgi:hypothetical protein